MNVRLWPVASDIAAQANVGIQGNSGRAEESQNPSFHEPQAYIGHLSPLAPEPVLGHFRLPSLTRYDALLEKPRAGNEAAFQSRR